MPRSFKSRPRDSSRISALAGALLPAEADDLSGFKSYWFLFGPVSAALFSSQASESNLQGRGGEQNTHQTLHFHRGCVFPTRGGN